MILHVDNQAALNILDDKFSWRTRHLASRASTVRAYAKYGEIELQWAETKAQIADCLTKHFGSKEAYEQSRKSIGLVPVE